MARTRASARPLTDHDEIRRWAEERNANPAHVKRTGGGEDLGMIRLDFPGYSGNESLEEISWDEWFEKFDERNLALLVQDKTAQGQKSNFNKLVSRDTLADTNGGGSSARRTKRTKSQEREERGAEEFSSEAGFDEEHRDAKVIEMEERPAASRRRTASAQRRARQPRSTSRGRRATAKSASSRGRSSRSSQGSSTRGQRSRSMTRSSRSERKPAARARGPQRTPRRGRAGGRRRAA